VQVHGVTQKKLVILLQIGVPLIHKITLLGVILIIVLHPGEVILVETIVVIKTIIGIMMETVNKL
jgi:hypothetical protein